MKWRRVFSGGSPVSGYTVSGPDGFVGKYPLSDEITRVNADGSSYLFSQGTCCTGQNSFVTDYNTCGKITGSEFFPYAQPNDIICDPAARPSPQEQTGVCSVDGTVKEMSRGDCFSKEGIFMGYGTKLDAIQKVFGEDGPRWGDRRYMVEFIVINRSKETVYLGATVGRGPDPGGVKLLPKHGYRLWMPKGCSFRLWARTGCEKFRSSPQAASKGYGCETGDCSSLLNCGPVGGVPPVTIAEFTTGGGGGQTFYDVSVVDGFNFPIQIVPDRSTIGEMPSNQSPNTEKYYCGTSGCTSNLNKSCPVPLQVVSENTGEVVACKSACAAFDTDQYCCRGKYGQPSTCNPKHWPTNYNQQFKEACPDAYSYAYDDSTSTYTCRGKQTNTTKERICETYHVYLG